ncbi:MAG TPA: hypothetical protein EYG89_03065 [Bacteroidia bacterium]|nr:hypothetical protein [Bacteroidia bacterium]
MLIFSSFAAGYYFSNSLKNIEVKKISIENKKKELLKKEKMFLEGERDKKINFIFNNFYAESILIKEFSGETIFEKKSDLILPIASLTKIFNAITALENTKNKTVLMTNRSLQAEGDYNIKPYEIFSMNDALRYMLIGSINDIASAISFGHTDLVNN